MDNKLPSNRTFGIFFFLFFTIFFGYSFIINFFIVSIFLSLIAIFFLFSTLFYESLLTPLNYWWMKFGNLLGMIISPLIMSILYLLIFVPVSLLFKITLRDELRLKMKKRQTHWKYREIETSSEENFKNQF